MKCKNCGYDLAFGVKYCAHCGSQVEIIENKDNDLSKYSKY